MTQDGRVADIVAAACPSPRGAVLARARLEGREELDNNGFARLPRRRRVKPTRAAAPRAFFIVGDAPSWALDAIRARAAARRGP
jgi:hypothetical protein